MTKLIGKVCLVFALLFGILSSFFLVQRNIIREERNSYRQQLVALCAAEDHAFMQGWDIKKIYLSEFDYLEVDPETAISFDAVKKNWNGTETKIRYTVFQGGKVVITGSGFYGQETFIQQMNLGSSVEFSKIGKK